jgi:hypothetical protein
LVAKNKKTKQEVKKQGKNIAMQASLFFSCLLFVLAVAQVIPPTHPSIILFCLSNNVDDKKISYTVEEPK